MKITQYQVDAFATEVFFGGPAAAKSNAWVVPQVGRGAVGVEES